MVLIGLYLVTRNEKAVTTNTTSSQQTPPIKGLMSRKRKLPAYA